jgi:membrane carboxypeptidase/penicillin-binding protein PbpC
VALPLAGKLFRALPAKNVPAWPEVDGALREVAICALSGLPADRWCPHTRNVFLPRDQYLHRVCDMHYPGPTQNSKNKATPTVIERWPGSVQGWDLAKIQSPVIPLFGRHEGQTGRAEDLCILEPSQRAEYVLTGEGNGDRIRLRTSVDAQVALHWYIDDHYLGDSTPSDPLFLKLESGEHRLTCMTPAGKTHTVTYRVLQPEAVRITATIH